MRAMSVVFRLIFVRHGETSANKDRRIQGHIDVALNGEGEQQARKAGLGLKDVAFNRSIASDLSRAKSTCSLILQQNEHYVPEITLDKRIRERFFGDAEGRLFEEVQQEIAQLKESWQSYNPTGSERLCEVQTRCVAFFKELCQSVYDKANVKGLDMNQNHMVDLQKATPSENVLVVSHGLCLKMMYLHLYKNLGCVNFPPSDVHNQLTANTGITEFLVRYSPRKYEVSCLRFNDARHLES